LKCRHSWRGCASEFANEIAAKQKTIIPGDEIDIDFTSSTISWRGENFAFPAPGQRAAVAGDCWRCGELVAKRLGRGLVLSPPRRRKRREMYGSFASLRITILFGLVFLGALAVISAIGI
jgi:hypothetical protein